MTQKYLYNSIKGNTITELEIVSNAYQQRMFCMKAKKNGAEVMAFKLPSACTEIVEGEKAHKVPEKPNLPLRHYGKKILCVECEVVFKSVKECAETLKVYTHSIYKALERGYAAKGMHFKYLD